MDISALFGLTVVATVLIAWASGDHVRQKVSLLLLFAWATSNMAIELAGFDKAPLIIPTIDAITAILVAFIGAMNRSRVAALIFGIYGLVGATWVTAYIFHAQGSYNCYATLNVMFAAQLIILGASSAWLAVHRWVGWSRKRLRLDPSRG